MTTFWDHVEVAVGAGDGGAGLVSFRRERGEARGGPDGGDGGDGGSVVLAADSGVNTLAEFARKRRFAAKNGAPGGKAKRHGKSADDLVLHVPVGTIVRDGDTLVADLAEPDARAVAARGGRGGFGNAHFTSSRRQAPRQAEKGEPGEERELSLELKLVADVGLIGIPSVGKSTFLRAVSAARPKVADYPFTTTVPMLGIAQVGGGSGKGRGKRGGDRLAVADIPGLIEGAHRGKGLGDAFLRHVERTKVLIHLLDMTREDPAADYRTIRRELSSYARSLARKPELVALNKADTLPPADAKRSAAKLAQRLGRPVRPVSAATGQGVDGLLSDAAAAAKRQRTKRAKVLPRLTVAELAPGAITVNRPPGRAAGPFEIRGPRLERLVRQTDFDNPEAAERFWWTARRLGLDGRLEKLGAGPGAPLRIAGADLEWPGPA